nr:hypothetical protein [Mucilaginibacter sp. L294]
MMKKLKALLITAITLGFLFTSLTGKAQSITKNTFKWSIAEETFRPVGHFHRESDFGIGGSVRMQYGLSDRVALTFTAGYYNFFVKAPYKNLGVEDYRLVPVKVGIKAFVLPHIYLAAEAGVGFEVNREKKRVFIASPGVGWANKSWDVGVRYENYAANNNGYGTLALRIAYGF